MLSYQHFIPFLQNVNDVLFRQEKKEKKKCTLSSSSFSNIDDENCNDTSTTKSKQLVEMEKISELYDHDLDKYLGIYWERETISKKVATQQPSVDPLPILNTIDLNVLMESDDEPVIETVIIHEYIRGLLINFLFFEFLCIRYRFRAHTVVLELWNFSVVKLKFNRFFHLNEPPTRIFLYSVRSFN